MKTCRINSKEGTFIGEFDFREVEKAGPEKFPGGKGVHLCDQKIYFGKVKFGDWVPKSLRLVIDKENEEFGVF